MAGRCMRILEEKDVIRIGLMTVQQEQKNQTHRLLVRQRHIMLLVML